LVFFPFLMFKSVSGWNNQVCFSTMTSMYHLPPILDRDVAIRLPTCMYRMEPIISSSGGSEKMQPAAESGAAAADLARLERRQEAILTRLDALKTQVEAAMQRRPVSCPAGGDVAVAMSATLPDHPSELVVVASPSSPPYSLLPLRRLMPSLSVTSHVHSSAPPVNAALTRLFSWRGAGARGPHLRLIWKDVAGEPALLVSPAAQCCPLAGEPQLCRYLARALLPHHYEGDAARAAEVDQLLAQADRLRSGNGKERQTVLRSLNATLGGRPFLLGSQMTLVDGAVWSAVRWAALPSPANVAAWSQRMDAAAGLGNQC